LFEDETLARKMAELEVSLDGVDDEHLTFCCAICSAMWAYGDKFGIPVDDILLAVVSKLTFVSGRKQTDNGVEKE